MKKFVSLSFKSLLKKLFVGEHFTFYESSIIAPLLSIIAGLPSLGGIFSALQAVFAKEDQLYKLSLAAFQTQEIHLMHEKRLSYFYFFRECVHIIKYDNDPALAYAIAKLEFLLNTYVNLPNENYYDQTGAMTNFLQDCGTGDNLAAIQLLTATQLFNLTQVVAKGKAANDTFKVLYEARAVDKEHVSQIGKLSEVRFDVDSVFDAFVDAVNVAWTSNEIGAKDPAVHNKLLEVREVINAGIHQAELTLARRSRHKIKDDNNTDDGTQTPITPPTPPPPGTQQPNTDRPDASQTTQNPTDEPHHLDPNEHPAMGERKADEQKKEDEKKKDEEKK
ncbi:MAG: DUF6261 family protein [Tannerellaceae bacterium]|jgi:hypothetical protein|nr:DUF6261 family protein [Tannerellaceae bacterium]